MTFYTAENLQTITAGQWLNLTSDFPNDIQAVSIDTRTLSKGQAYIAIVGQRLDGHQFLTEAVSAGASMLVTSDEQQSRDCMAQAGESCPPILLVEDTAKALQALASAYRYYLGQHNVKVIAVTGSNGKTTTRHLIHQILSAKYRGTQSPESFNNHIGLPLTLLGASPADDFVVAEIGSNHPGEVESLAEIARPDIAVITHIGQAHIGHFGSRQAIADEKAGILKHVLICGYAVVPGDEPLLKEAISQLHPQIGRIEIVQPTVMATTEHTTTFLFRRQEATVPLIGRHNARNALAAAMTGRLMKMNDAEIIEALGQIKAVNMRLNVTSLGRSGQEVTILNDAYNANPDSVKAAINTLAEYPAAKGRRVLVLADMLELGEQGPDLHREIAKVIVGRSEQFGLVVCIGELSKHTADAIGEHLHGESIHAYMKWDEHLPETVAELLQPGDVVLLKGSRGMALEKLLPAVKDKFE